MGILTRYPINPLGEAFDARRADEQSLGQMICELELELLALKALIAKEDDR